MSIRRRIISCYKIVLSILLLYSLLFQSIAIASSDDCLSLISRFISDKSSISRAHSAITHDLFWGQPIEIHSFTRNRNRGKLYKMTIYNSRSGNYREVLFKPRTFGDRDGWNRTPMEYVAYEVNQMLGMDYVPPVAYRKDINIDGFTEGAFIYFVPDAHDLHHVPFHQWSHDFVFKDIDKRLFLSDTRILDILLANPDRHIDNFMRGKHWVDGVYRPMLVDHASCLRHETHNDLIYNDAFNGGKVRFIRKIVWRRLHALNFEKLQKMFHQFVSDDEIRQILSRRDGIVRYFRDRIDKYGYDAVVFDR